MIGMSTATNKDGWRGVERELRANIERMRKAKYRDEAICEDLIKVIPEDLLPVLCARLALVMSAQSRAEKAAGDLSER
jgi:hypothetical protein